MVPAQTTAMVQMLETSADSLARSVAALDDTQVAEPSLLPGWSRGHVLTHLARNADALGNLLTWARTGVETPMYPSRAVRDADIEAGAPRSAAEHRADVQDSQARLMSAVAGMSDEHWRAQVRFGSDQRTGSAEVVPWLRLVEVEVHHVDLDVGYTPAHWDPAFVERQLDRVVDDRRAREDTPPLALHATDTGAEHRLGAGGPVVSGPQAALLAWLVGRSDGAGLSVRGAGGGDVSPGPALPRLAPWR